MLTMSGESLYGERLYDERGLKTYYKAHHRDLKSSSEPTQPGAQAKPKGENPKVQAEKDPGSFCLLILRLGARDVFHHVYFSQGYVVIHMTWKRDSRLLCSGLRFWLALGNVIYGSQ